MRRRAVAERQAVPAGSPSAAHRDWDRDKRVRIEIPDARYHPPPSQVVAVPAMNPVPAAPAMKVVRPEMADVAVPAPFAMFRYWPVGIRPTGRQR